jgi:hypothetical protein
MNKILERIFNINKCYFIKNEIDRNSMNQYIIYNDDPVETILHRRRLARRDINYDSENKFLNFLHYFSLVCMLILITYVIFKSLFF